MRNTIATIAIAIAAGAAQAHHATIAPVLGAAGVTAPLTAEQKAAAKAAKKSKRIADAEKRLERAKARVEKAEAALVKARQ